ncbi:hypothetical protein ACN47E_002073 [Coniothyrium glycines]
MNSDNSVHHTSAVCRLPPGPQGCGKIDTPVGRFTFMPCGEYDFKPRYGHSLTAEQAFPYLRCRDARLACGCMSEAQVDVLLDRLFPGHVNQAKIRESWLEPRFLAYDTEVEHLLVPIVHVCQCCAVLLHDMAHAPQVPAGANVLSIPQHVTYHGNMSEQGMLAPNFFDQHVQSSSSPFGEGASMTPPLLVPLQAQYMDCSMPTPHGQFQDWQASEFAMPSPLAMDYTMLLGSLDTDVVLAQEQEPQLPATIDPKLLELRVPEPSAMDLLTRREQRDVLAAVASVSHIGA